MHSLPLLLPTPPLVKNTPEIGQVKPDWQEPTHSVSSTPRLLPDLILSEGVGGPFWAKPAPFSKPVLVCAPNSPEQALHLWKAARTRHSVTDLAFIAPFQGRQWEHLQKRITRDGGRVLTETVNPSSLLQNAQTLLTSFNTITPLSALAAFRALPIWQPSVDGSWSDSPDAHTAARALSILQDGTTYTCPFSGTSLSPESAITLLGEWRRFILHNRNIRVCIGMSFWKQKRIAEFFATANPDRPTPFFRRTTRSALKATHDRSGIAVWATRMPKHLEQESRKRNIPLFRVEDGFIRSAGLGSGFLPPASIIADQRGAYYDPAQPSDLEILLANHPLGPDLQTRAQKLTSLILANAISKYATGGTPPALNAPDGKRILLVPGQVADDLSVRLGSKTVTGNMALLECVRAHHPDAFILYRPHPDVDAGHRAGALPDHQVLTVADRIYRDGPMAPLLDSVDEVHTMTSLTGFEALMRNKPVTTYGQPFYAGWGLTQDHAPLARRTRILNVSQLVAATLLLYPRYIDPQTGLPCGPEVLIERFKQAELWRPGLLMRIRHHQGSIRKAATKGVQAVFQKFANVQVRK